MTDIMAISAHPDDSEITSGGMLLRLKQAGKKIVLVDVTHGEAGTRGDGKTRDEEAKAAAEMLGAERWMLNYPDSGLHDNGDGIAEDLVQLIREQRPRVLLAPYPIDLHPDHARVGKEAQAAFFLSGVAKRSPGKEAYRPRRIFHYMSHHRFTPSFCVDVSGVWEEKMKLIECYGSQLKTADGGKHLPNLTNIKERIEIRDRFFGHYLGVRYAEPYWVEGPVKVGDPLEI